VRVFVDYQNVYMRARQAFAVQGASYVEGQIKPLRLGLLLVDRGRSVNAGRQLDSVYVFRGEPSPKHSPRGFAACQRQVAEWARVSQVVPHTRPLQYLPSMRSNGQPSAFDAREKGIDVLLALAMVMGAVRDEYDVAVLCSADTDLVPALEQVHALGKVCETMAWKPPQGYGQRLKVPGGGWCHFLDLKTYELLHDATDYS